MSRLSWAIDTSLSIPKREYIEKALRDAEACLRAEARRQIARGSETLIGLIHRELPPGDAEERLASTAALLSVALLMGNDGIGGVVAGARARAARAETRPRPVGGSPKDWIAVPDDAVRFTAPVDFLTRVATRDITVAGAEIRAGEVMLDFTALGQS